MKQSFLALLIFVVFGTANATIITVDHDTTYLPPSGYYVIDLDDDGFGDINLASNFYVSIWGGDTQFTTPYFLTGEVIDASSTWRQGNTWLDLYGNIQDYVQDDLLYLGVRNTSIGDYYGYITFNYYSDTNSVSLNSFTYEDSGSAITVASSTTTVPAPTSLLLLSLGLVGLCFKRMETA